MLGRRMALGTAASTWLPAPRIQVPNQVLALLQEGLLLALRVLEDDKLAVPHLCCGQFPLLRSISGQLLCTTGSQLAYLAVSALLRRLFIFVRLRGCRCSGLTLSISIILFFFLGVVDDWNKDTLPCVVTINW